MTARGKRAQEAPRRAAPCSPRARPAARRAPRASRPAPRRARRGRRVVARARRPRSERRARRRARAPARPATLEATATICASRAVDGVQQRLQVRARARDQHGDGYGRGAMWRPRLAVRNVTQSSRRDEPSMEVAMAGCDSTHRPPARTVAHCSQGPEQSSCTSSAEVRSLESTRPRSGRTDELIVTRARPHDQPADICRCYRRGASLQPHLATPVQQRR